MDHSAVDRIRLSIAFLPHLRKVVPIYSSVFLLHFELISLLLLVVDVPLSVSLAILLHHYFQLLHLSLQTYNPSLQILVYILLYGPILSLLDIPVPLCLLEHF